MYLNGNRVKELLQVSEAVKYVQEKTNEIFTIPKKVIQSREKLINLFGNMNDTLRLEGLRAGIERFSEFANSLFLKLLSETSGSTIWNDIKNQQEKYRIDFINGAKVLEHLKSQYGGDVFTSLKIKKPRTLSKIIELLDTLSLTLVDTDIKGSAFEYFLEKTTSTQNDLGE